MHLNSELLFRKYALPYFKSGLRILELGPAGHPSSYQKVVNDNSITWHTIDFPESKFIINAVSNLTYTISDPYAFPVEDNQYDIVLSGQVIEHVQQVWVWMKELKRVLKKGGYIVTINPVSWPYHEAPIDCWRIFPSGIEAIAKESGLKVQLCFFESLEINNILKVDPKAKFIPGEAYNYRKTTSHLRQIIQWNKIVRKVPYLKKIAEVPIEVSYDTISVLKK